MLREWFRRKFIKHECFTFYSKGPRPDGSARWHCVYCDAPKINPNSTKDTGQ